MNDKALIENEQLPMRDMAHSLPMALLMAREAVMSRFRAMLSEYELTEQQWRVLRALMEVDCIDIVDLAKRCYILAPSVSRILKYLEERQYIIRCKAELDRRRFLISITEKGKDLFTMIAPQSEEIYADITKIFGQTELDDLLESLHRMTTEIGGHSYEENPNKKET